MTVSDKINETFYLWPAQESEKGIILSGLLTQEKPKQLNSFKK